MILFKFKSASFLSANAVYVRLAQTKKAVLRLQYDFSIAAWRLLRLVDEIAVADGRHNFTFYFHAVERSVPRL